MYSYIKGTIVEVNFDHVILDHQGIGYHVFVANPYDFHKEETITLYIHQNIREDAQLLFGFKSKEQKELFLRLISVKGIGPKTAIGILATADVKMIVLAIEEENVSYLRKIPGIGPKAAQQIILDLKGKLTKNNVSVKNQNLSEAIEVLKALGYKTSEINNVEKKLSDENLDTNDYVKKALNLLMK